jgi:2-succinyl-6-hydroxy-2,4-cyclohexadiene-1-carboxylate synthase
VHPTQVTPLGAGLVACSRSGHLDTVMWFHGYAMDSTVWQPLWARLPGWHHLGLDLPGHGRSRRIEPGEDRTSLARLIGGLAEQHDVRHLVGLSFGTILALEVAMQAPLAFDTLVLGSPALAGGPHDPDVAQRYEELARLYPTLGPGPDLARAWMRDPPPLFRGARRHPTLWLHLFRLASAHPWTELVDGSMLALTSPAQDPSRLSAVRASTLLLVGEDDLAAHRLAADVISHSLPACRRRDVNRAGHLCLLERPSAVAASIDAHLRGEPA